MVFLHGGQAASRKLAMNCFCIWGDPLSFPGGNLNYTIRFERDDYTILGGIPCWEGCFPRPL